MINKFKPAQFKIWESASQFHALKGVLIESIKSAFQKIDVIHTHEFGNVLFCEDEIQCSTANSKHIHESLIHYPMLFHKRLPKNVLIIGGGDGGSVTELIKYPDLQVDIVEIDPGVVDVCKIHFPELNNWDKPGINLMIGDGIAFVKTTANKYDRVILDIPGGVNEGAKYLHSKEFFQEVANVMTEDGVVVSHCESPDGPCRETHIEIIKGMREVFKHVHTFRVWIPFYAEYWTRVVASNQPRDLHLEYFDKLHTEWLTPELMEASFNAFGKGERF